MIITAIVLMAIGSFGVGAATLMEYKKHEPKWSIMMKIFPWLIGVGGVLLGIALAGG